MPLSLPAVALNSSTSFWMIGPPTGSLPGFQYSRVTGSCADVRLMLKSWGAARPAVPAAAVLSKLRRSSRERVIMKHPFSSRADQASAPGIDVRSTSGAKPTPVGDVSRLTSVEDRPSRQESASFLLPSG